MAKDRCQTVQNLLMFVAKELRIGLARIPTTKTYQIWLNSGTKRADLESLIRKQVVEWGELSNGTHMFQGSWYNESLMSSIPALKTDTWICVIYNSNLGYCTEYSGEGELFVNSFTHTKDRFTLPTSLMVAVDAQMYQGRCLSIVFLAFCPDSFSYTYILC